MSRAIRVLLKDVLVYAQKKGGLDFAASLDALFSSMRSCISDNEIVEVRDQYLAIIREMKIVVTQKEKKYYLTVSGKVFRIYCDRNKQNRLFLVVDYWRQGGHHYCYQLLSNNLTITSFG